MGGWQRLGVDTSFFSHSLLAEIKDLVGTGMSPKEMMVEGLRQTFEIGGATCLVSQLSGATLEIANVGDSELVVFRKGAEGFDVIFATRK